MQDIRLSYCSVWHQQCPDRTSGQDRHAPRKARRGRLRYSFTLLPEQLERLLSETRKGTLSPAQSSVIGSRLLTPEPYEAIALTAAANYLLVPFPCFEGTETPLPVLRRRWKGQGRQGTALQALRKSWKLPRNSAVRNRGFPKPLQGTPQGLRTENGADISRAIVYIRSLPLTARELLKVYM